MHYIELSNLWVGKAQGVHALHYTVMYNSAFFCLLLEPRLVNHHSTVWVKTKVTPIFFKSHLFTKVSSGMQLLTIVILVKSTAFVSDSTL